MSIINVEYISIIYNNDWIDKKLKNLIKNINERIRATHENI